MRVPKLIERLVGSTPIRRGVDAAFSRYAARRTKSLDRQPIAQRQQTTLLKLVRLARDTKFGRDHGFATIRTVADYQCQVPLRRYEDFWSEYWEAAYPESFGNTWPGRIPYLALSSGTTSGATKYIPVSREMLRSNQRAAFTALAWQNAADSGMQLFSGRTLFLGGSTDLKRATQQKSCRQVFHKLTNGAQPSTRPLAGDLSGIAAQEFPQIMRPFVFPPLDLALSTDWEFKLARMAELSASLPITAVSGVPSWLLVLFEELRRQTGRSTIAEIWPKLRLVIHGGTRFDPYHTLFRKIIGDDSVRFLETYPASEGFVAAEDPRYGLLRLIPDHDLFFEFVPVDELDHPNPTRHTVAEIVPGIRYAVVLTTCAGLWSYVLGDTVCFESADPPLLRFVGRTQQYLSAFGEHLIGEEVERAVTRAADVTASSVVDFHVGPAFPESPGEVGRHRFFIEFAVPPQSTSQFGLEIDAALSRYNEDYCAHRAGDLTIRAPEIITVRPGGFVRWMHSRGKLGGQNKVPRMDNSGRLTDDLSAWLQRESNSELPRSA